MRREELLDWLVLNRVAGIGPVRFKALLDGFGDVSRVLGAGAAELTRCGLPKNVVAALARADTDLARRDLAWLDQSDSHHIVSLACDTYPALLKEITDPPPLLFVIGDPALLASPQIAVVGSRNPSPTGKRHAHQFARTLGQIGLTITSGLAIGVDTAAHQGALHAGGQTIAVLGSGLDQLYPRRNKELARQIARQGALVSEFPPGTQALAEHFPRRNRIISGLSCGTLVVEAAPKSGSLITARLAAEQGREVFSIPGSIHNPTSRGCHALIRQGAKLVESVDDILEEFEWLQNDGRTFDSGPLFDAPPVLGLDGNSMKLLDKMGFEAVSVDALVEQSQLTSEEVSSILLSLELRGLVASAPGGLYTKQTQLVSE